MSSSRRRVVPSLAQHSIVAGLLACLCSAAPTRAQADAPVLPPEPPRVSIKSVEAFGCNATPIISADGSNVRIAFNHLEAAVGAEKSVSSANCHLTFEVAVPEGYAYALTDLHGAGNVSLEPGVSAAVFASSSFSGLGSTGTHTLLFRGPTERAFAVDGALEGGERGAGPEGFSPCGTNRRLHVDLNLSMRAEETGKQGTVALSELGSFGFAVRPCER